MADFPALVRLPHLDLINGLDTDERGQNWIWSDDMRSHFAAIKLQKRVDPPNSFNWLVIELRPDNYPGLQVCAVIATEEHIGQIMLEYCEDWVIRKCNLAVPWYNDELKRIPCKDDDDEKDEEA